MTPIGTLLPEMTTATPLTLFWPVVSVTTPSSRNVVMTDALIVVEQV